MNGTHLEADHRMDSALAAVEVALGLDQSLEVLLQNRKLSALAFLQMEELS